MSGHSPRPELRPGENPGSSTFQGRLAAWRAVPAPDGGGGGDGTLSKFFDTQGNQLLVSEIQNQQFVVDANGIFYIPQFDGLGNFTGVDLASSSQQSFLSGQTGGDTGSAPSFASTQAAQTQAEAFAKAQAEADRKFRAEQDRLAIEARAEQDRLAEEAALKRGRLSTLTDLIQSFVASQAQARDTLANLQPDPFRFAAVSGGIAPFGVTPQQGFQQQLTDFASAPVPTADPNASLPSIESAIQGLTGASVPLSPQVFGGAGLAGGGTVPAPFDVMSARLVGEGGPEVMITGPQGVTILPLGKGAQEGGFFPFSPIEFDKETLLPALGTSGIFGSLGFSGIPQTGPAKNFGGARLPILSTLGIQPQLIQNSVNRQTFFIDEQGRTRFIPDPAASGVNTGDIVRLSGPEFQSLYGSVQHGPHITGEFSPPVPTGQASAFTKFSAPIVEPTTGTLLPAPFTIASQLNKLRLTDPFTFNLLLSAYQSAGVPAVDVLATVQQALSFGQARQNIGLN